jgi:hypothetical protein
MAFKKAWWFCWDKCVIGNDIVDCWFKLTIVDDDSWSNAKQRTGTRQYLNA